MANQLYTLTARDANTIRDQALRTLTSGLRARGIAKPNTGPGSDYYILAQAFAAEAAVAEANGVLSVNQQMPDSGDLTCLQRWGNIFNKPLRGAASSRGNVVNAASAATLIVAGTGLVDANQQPYKTTRTGIYQNGDLIPIVAVNGGSTTNHAAGDTLSWATAPGYCAPTVLVAAGGLTGSSDQEDTESYRARILAQFATPPGNGNWQYVANQAYDASPSVGCAVVYPALQGGATVHVAVAGIPSATSKTRALDPTLVSSVVQPYIQGQIPEHVYINVTPTVDQPIDLVIGLSLPAAPGASPPGAGGGWIDNNPWPNAVANAFTAAYPEGTVLGPSSATPVPAAPTSTTMYVFARSAPTAISTNVSWLSPINWQLYSAVVVAAVQYSANIWQITLSAPFPGIAAGAYLWPTAANGQAYVNAILQQFALMGPGEKAPNASIAQRGFRRPTSTQQWPYLLNAVQLRGLIDAGPEVNDASYVTINRAGSSLPYGSGMSGVAPTIPTNVANGPSIFVPNNIGFYPL